MSRAVRRSTLLDPLDVFISIDNFRIWRRHLAWSTSNGKQLRDHMTQRFASNMVFMSLLLSAEVGVLFSPSSPAEQMRQRLKESLYDTYDFWAGIVLCTAIFFTLCTLVATFTAWAVISVLSENNAHCVIRSSIGIYAIQLPSRVIVLSIYTFFLWMAIFMHILLPQPWAIVLTVGAILLFFHIVIVYSSLAKLIMYTSAMSKERIFNQSDEEKMLPDDLEEALLEKAWTWKKEGVDVTQQYRTSVRLDDGDVEVGQAMTRRRNGRGAQ